MNVRLALVLLLAAPCLAQEAAKAPVEREVWVDFEAGWWQAHPEDGTLVLAGNVQLRWEGGSLRADHGVAWGSFEVVEDRSESEKKLRISEIYVEGNVFARFGERMLECARAYIDPVANRGLFFDATMSAWARAKSGNVKITLRAGELRQLASDRFQAIDLSLTTNPHAGPGYYVASPEARVQIDPPARKPGGREGETVRNIHYALDGTVLYLEGVPVFATPAISGNTAEPRFSWIKRVGADNSRKFGPSVYLSIGSDIEFTEGERWGEWTVNTQYLGDRGPGLGVDLEYQTPEYLGYLQTLYQRDTGRDQLFGLPDDKNRGRVLWRHRHRLPEDIQLDLEVSKISDRGFLLEYFEDEFKSGKEQETLIYVKRAVENRALTFLANTRINRFQDQVEYQPQLGYQVQSEPLFDIGDAATVYFDSDYEVTRARRRFDGFDNLKNYRSFRADFDNTLAVPFFAGPVKLEPFGGFRYTRYGNGRLTSQSLDRFGTLFGLRATTQLSRTFRIAGGPLNLEGLRHVILPEIEYTRVNHVSRELTDYPQFDAIDEFTERESIRFGVRNRLQTIWHDRGVPRVVDIVDLDIEWRYFPEPDRDNFGRHAGNIDVDFVLRVTPEFTLLTDFEYSFVFDAFEIFNSTVAWAPTDDFQLATGYRRYIDTNDAVFVQARWQASERVAMGVFSAWDFEEARAQDQRFFIQRIGVDWVFELEFDLDNSGGVGFGIAFSPRALFDPRLRSRSLRNEPQFLNFNDNRIR